MSVTLLKRAITLIKQGKYIKAQELLKPVIATDHHNLPAWFLFVETYSTNKQRLDVLEICLEYNPDSEQVKLAVEKLRALPIEKLRKLPLRSSHQENLRHFDLLFITFGVAILINALLTIVSAHGLFELIVIFLNPFFIITFPIGLTVIIPQIYKNSSLTTSIIIGWSIYLVIFLLGTLTKNRSVFIFIYIVFLALLILNIAGCIQIADQFSFSNM